MQSVSSRIWTRVAVSISYDDNHYTTGTYADSAAMTNIKIESFCLKFEFMLEFMERFLCSHRI